ncbi:1-phosphofructokinase [Propionibacteriaceae bacterium ES.041]|uniref:1-phosphofructokinase family hexose kinase n=1 Tax=Enemella evansiae TaxID=2016499 RepID=UPI000B977472|nr:1-phosphofructokinase family hexose kinase [Enemella evansiae]OYN99289.1 1-phosphofructokinase [Enemella evansiae]PFG67143.1 1-phosphofructokinase [Propionibacteriaceae bacterium ES.041]
MILTVTPNPSVDRTVFLDRTVLGSVNRADHAQSEPSGKGVNVAIALHSQGRVVEAVVPVGGHVGAQLASMLEASGLPTSIVPISGELRSNISLTEPSGRVTKINEAGPRLSESECDALIDAITRRVPAATVVVTAGSLGAGTPVDLHARIARACGDLPVVLDSSGEPLRAGITAQPALIKPNVHELAELVGGELHTVGDVIDAAQQIRATGVGAVLASLGADGAVLVDAEGALQAVADIDRVASTVGAGDALLAGFLGSDGDRIDRLVSAVRWGSAAVQTAGTLFDPDDFTGSVAAGAADPRRPLHDDELGPATRVRQPSTNN